MSVRSIAVLQRYLRRLRDEAVPPEDAVLLRRFVAAEDREAFALLVARHGPLVLGTARRFVGNAHDAEDVFQAVFLSLARLAKTIRQGCALPAWLHRATCRIAAKVLKERHSGSGEPSPEPCKATDPAAHLVWREVRQALDEELQCLPERLRSPLVLCYLSGLTRDEAARQLGWSLGTLKRRLEEGRKALRIRLTRRGITSVGLALPVLTPEALHTVVSTSLFDSTLRLTFSARTAVHATVAALAVRSATTTRGLAMKSILALAAAVALGVGGYLLVRHWGEVPGRESRAEGGTVVVVALYPGASAEEVERQVTIPLEVTLAGMPGLRSVRSRSLFGLSELRLEFEDRVAYARARQEVINRLGVIDRPLPAGVTPTLSPAAAGYEILRYTLRGPKDAQGKDVYTPADLRALQDWVVEREFRHVPGVVDVTGSGGAVTRYEVQLDPDRLRRYGITLQQVQKAVAESNANVGDDYVRQGDLALNVRAVGLFGRKEPVQRVLGMKDPAEAAARLRAEEQRRVREMRSLVVATVNNVPVRLEDVVEGGRLAPGETGSRGVVLGRQPGQTRVGIALPGAPDEDDRVLDVVFLGRGEDRQETLDHVQAAVREINDTPGRLLPGVRLEPLWERAGGAADDLLILRAGLPANVSPRVASDQMRQARALLLHHPEVRAVLTQLGPEETGVDPAESGQVYALLGPGKDRPRGRQGVLDAVQAELTRSLPGIDWEDMPDGVDDFGAAFVATPGAGLLHIIGPDFDELERLAGKARGELQKVAGVSGVHVRHVMGKTNLEFRVDPDKCARLGVSVADVNNFIALALDSRAAAPVIKGEKTLDISIGLANVLRNSERSILDIPFDIVNSQVVPSGPGVTPAPAGSSQPPPAKVGNQTDTANPISNSPRLRLRDLVSPVGADGSLDPQAPFERPGAASIWRENGRRLIAVRFAIRGRGEAAVLAEAREKLAPLFPAPYRAEWSGGAR
jgi:RNA polymerase sigma factor (sigma-70 family)